MIWKVWKDPSVVYFIEKDTADEALAEVRKLEPGANTTQACTEEEAEIVRKNGGIING